MQIGKTGNRLLAGILIMLLHTAVWSQTVQDSTTFGMDSLGGVDYAPAYHYKLNPYIAQCIEPQLIDTMIWGGYNDDRSLYGKDLWAGLGNYGQAQQSINYSFHHQHGFNYHTLPYNNYIRTFDNWDLYTLPTTYANIAYNFVSTKEHHFSGTYAQRITNNLTLNANMETILAGGRYVNQKVRDVNTGIGLSYLMPNRRYGIKLYYSFSLMKLGENGGLEYDSNFSNKSATSLIRFTSAGTQTRHHNIFLRHYVSISPKAKNEDKKSPNIGYLVHDLNYIATRYHFYDYNPQNTFYDIFIFNADSTMDTHRFHQLRTSLYWTNYMPEDTLENKAYFLHFAAGLSYSYSRVTDTIATFNDHALTPIGTIHTRLFSRLELKADIQGTVLGYNMGDLTINGMVKVKINKKENNTHYIAGLIDLYNYEPDYMLTHYISNNYLWDNELKKQQTFTAQVLWHWNGYEIGAHYYMLHHFTMLNEHMQVEQPDKTANIYQLSAYIPLDIKGFGWHANMYVQYCDNKNIHLPLFATRQTIYYGFYMFKKAMYLLLGVDFMYNTSYYANAYNPALQMFYVQNNTKIGNYGYLDVFLKAKINRVTLQAKLTHVWSGLFTQYYLTPHYPAKGFGFAVGVNWRFHD